MTTTMDCCDRSWKDLCAECDNLPIADWQNHDHSDPADPVLGHHDELPGRVTCGQVVEEWQKWIFPIPNNENPVRIKPQDPYQSPRVDNPIEISGNKIYMTAFAPFVSKQDNLQTIEIPVKANSYILVPILTAEANPQEYTSLNTEAECFALCTEETNTTRRLELCVDGTARVGCYEERTGFLRIENIPPNNHMNIPFDRLLQPGRAITIVYNGYWALIDVNRLASGPIHGTGDHLITFEGEGSTYFVGGTLSVNVLD